MYTSISIIHLPVSGPGVLFTKVSPRLSLLRRGIKMQYIEMHRWWYNNMRESGVEELYDIQSQRIKEGSISELVE